MTNLCRPREDGHVVGGRARLPELVQGRRCSRRSVEISAVQLVVVVVWSRKISIKSDASHGHGGGGSSSM